MRRLADGRLFASALDARQIRAVCRAGVGLRWVAIMFAAFVGIVTPHAPGPLIVEIPAAIVYNGLVMLALMRAEESLLGTIALVTTLIDQLFCLAFIAVYAPPSNSGDVAAYIPATIEAVAFFGVAGAVLSTTTFIAGFAGVQLASTALWHGSLNVAGIFFGVLVVALIATCLAAVHEAVRPQPQPLIVASNGHLDGATSAQRLTDREQEILRLIADGSSNAVIANRLGISERAVKKCVERILTQLRARNRVEAVAAASRLRLI